MLTKLSMQREDVHSETVLTSGRGTLSGSVHCIYSSAKEDGISEFAGRLRMLADKAFPSWKAKWPVISLINGVASSSIQLKLMQGRPDTLDNAVTLACQLDQPSACHKQQER